MVRLGLVRLDLERGVDFAQEQPGPVTARDKIGVLTLPADAGLLRQGLLHHWRSVHEHFHPSPEAATTNWARCFSMPLTGSW